MIPALSFPNSYQSEARALGLLKAHASGCCPSEMASNVPAKMRAIRLTFITGKVLKKKKGQGW
jgi:hypothetical protein